MLFKEKEDTSSSIQPIHCGPNIKKEQVNTAILDGMWTTLISEATTDCMKRYIHHSPTCTKKIVPELVKESVKKYEHSKENQVRSLRLLYDGGLIASRKYTNIRNGGDVGQKSAKSKKTVQFMDECPIPKYIPYKSLMNYVRSIDIGELLDLEDLAKQLSLETVHGMYRPLTTLLLRLADHYLLLDSKDPCLHWFNAETNVFYVAVGADGAPFGRDDTATAYLVSILNILKKVQSCDENHLLLGANCSEDHPLLKKYTELVGEEMEKIEGKPLTNPNSLTVKFKFQLIPGDMKWVASMSGELSNSAQYFSSFADVHQDDKGTIGGSIGNSDNDKWHPWDYNSRLQVVQKVKKFKVTSQQKGRKGNIAQSLPNRSEVTKFIASQKSRQEFMPPLGKCVDKIKAEPLHVTNNDMLGYGLGLNSMQGREAKHVKLKNYVNNTCNVRKQLRWAIVFRHEFVSLLWLREADPCYTSTQGKLVSYIPKKVQNGDCLTCNCGLSKSATEEGCKLCASNIMTMIKQSVELGKVTDTLQEFGNLAS